MLTKNKYLILFCFCLLLFGCEKDKRDVTVSFDIEGDHYVTNHGQVNITNGHKNNILESYVYHITSVCADDTFNPDIFWFQLGLKDYSLGKNVLFNIPDDIYELGITLYDTINHIDDKNYLAVDGWLELKTEGNIETNKNVVVKGRFETKAVNIRDDSDTIFIKNGYFKIGGSRYVVFFGDSYYTEQ